MSKCLCFCVQMGKDREVSRRTCTCEGMDVEKMSVSTHSSTYVAMNMYVYIVNICVSDPTLA